MNAIAALAAGLMCHSISDDANTYRAWADPRAKVSTRIETIDATHAVRFYPDTGCVVMCATKRRDGFWYPDRCKASGPTS